MNAQHPLLIEELQNIARLPYDWEPLRGKTVAVTGAGGLVGNYLTRALDCASRVHDLRLNLIALCRNPERARTQLTGLEGVQYRVYDAAKPVDPDFRADYIVHAAGNAHPMAFASDPVGTLWGNVYGTHELLENVRVNGGRLLLISTGEIYGESPEISAFDETGFGAVNPMTARACYPESKRAAEALCAAYAAQYKTDALAARLTYVYGPTITDTNSRADAQFLRKALAGENIVMKSAGTQVRSWCYAADAAAALILLLLKGEAGQAYNVAGRTGVADIRTYAETLAQLAGVRVIFDLPPESESRGYSKVTRAVLDPSKLEALGFRARYDLREGLEHTLKIAGQS